MSHHFLFKSIHRWARAAAIPCAVATLSVSGFAQKPNVIMIYTDDMGYGDISSFSNALSVETPNIDRLATGGMKFTQFYVSMPICSPSRAAVLSGMYSPESRLTNYLQERSGNYASDANDWMDPEFAYLPKSFQAAGYATAHVGKWHLGGGRDIDNAPSIGEYGYDEFSSTWESPNPDPELGIQYPPWNVNSDPGQVPRHERTEWMVDRTLRFIDDHEGEPCFVTLWPDDLHTPFWPSPEMIAKYNPDQSKNNTLKHFHGVLEEYDRQIGRLLDGLDTRGLTNDTIIFFTGDNGPSPNYSGHMRTDGLRGRKLSLYEGGVREPFLIRWPGHIPAGSENTTTIMSTVDLLLTLTSLAGVPLSPDAQANTDGEDLSQAMLGTPIERSEPLFWEYGRTGQVPRPGSGNIDRSPILAIREGDYKLLVNPGNTVHQLYNVRTDPNETNNLAAAQPARVQSMAQQVIAWSNTLPHRTHPYPVYTTINFDQFAVKEIAPAATLRDGAGAAATQEIAGVAVDPYWYGDVYAIHADVQGSKAILRIDDGGGTVTKIADSGSIAADLGLPGSDEWPLVAGFDYAPGGNRLFLAQANPESATGQVLLVQLDASTGVAAQVAHSSALQGLSDLSGLPDGTLAAARGADGNRTIGNINVYYGNWIQKVTEAQLISITPAATQLPPKALGANSSGGEVYASAGGDLELFRLLSFTGSPSISRLTQTALGNLDLHDLSVDQAGNLFGLDLAGNRIVIVRKNDGLVYFVTFAEITSALGSTAPFVPTQWRGLAARSVEDKHTDLYLASSTADYGIVRVRFGPWPTSVDNWTLY